MKRAEIPSCDACEAYEENPHDYVEAEICPSCPWQTRTYNPRLDRLLYYLALTDAPCPVGRHELANADWLALGTLRAERARIAAENMKKR